MSSRFSGILYKQRSGFGKFAQNSWKKRLVTYDANILLYHKINQSDSFPRGSLNFNYVNYTISFDKICDAPNQYIFQINTPDNEPWIFCALNENDYKLWINILTKNVNEITQEQIISPEQTQIQPTLTLESEQTQIQPTLTLEPDQIYAPICDKKEGEYDDKSLKYFKIFVLIIINMEITYIVWNFNIITAIIYYCVINYITLTIINMIDNAATKINLKENQLDCPQSELSVELNNNITDIRTDNTNNINNINNTDVIDNIISDTISNIDNDTYIPGQTYRQFKNNIDENTNNKNTWSEANHINFSLRGLDYLNDSKKLPSEDPIYEPFAVDVFYTKSRIDHIAKKFQLPKNSVSNNSTLPNFFIVQVQLPTESPSMFSYEEDGVGLAIVLFFKLKSGTDTNSPQVKLFNEWCNKASIDNDWKGRFKLICSCPNLNDLNFPSILNLESYNAKPILIRKTSSVFKGDDYVEINIHVHKFSNFAKQCIFLLYSSCSQLFMQMGFVIEGREKSELPESLLGCIAINKPDLCVL